MLNDDQILDKFIKSIAQISPERVEKDLKENREHLMRHARFQELRQAVLNAERMTEAKWQNIFTPTTQEILAGARSGDLSLQKLGQLMDADILDRAQGQAVAREVCERKLASDNYGLDDIIMLRDQGIVADQDTQRMAFNFLKINPRLLDKSKKDQLGLSEQQVREILGNDPVTLEHFFPPEPLDPPVLDRTALHEIGIESGHTNIILVGITGSGKTMLLSSLIYEAFDIIELRGLPHKSIKDYYNFLADLPVKGKTTRATASGTVVSMPLNFRKNSRYHVNTNLIELAGEDFAQMERKNDIIDDFQPLFNSNNRNIIYFVLDYTLSVKDITDRDTEKQRTEINSAFNILNHRKVFEKTNHLGIIISKWDKCKEYKSAKDFFNDPKNKFMNAVKNQVMQAKKKYGLAVQEQTFSIGEVADNGVSFTYNGASGKALLQGIMRDASSKKG